jgi:hypothetical protein
MELVWMEFYYKKPTVHKIYWVTVVNKYWDEPKAMFLDWSEENVRGTKQDIWKLDGSKIPSTWEVTYWLELPPAKKD